MSTRIPTIDKFICGWYPYKFGLGFCWRDLEDIKREIDYGNTRVKN